MHLIFCSFLIICVFAALIGISTAMASKHPRQMLSYKPNYCISVYFFLLCKRWTKNWLSCWDLQSGGQWHKVHLEASHSSCTPGADCGANAIKDLYSDSDDGEQSTLGSLQTTESWEGQYLNTRNYLFTLWLVKQQKRLPTDIAFTGCGPG